MWPSCAEHARKEGPAARRRSPTQTQFLEKMETYVFPGGFRSSRYPRTLRHIPIPLIPNICELKQISLNHEEKQTAASVIAVRLSDDFSRDMEPGVVTNTHAYNPSTQELRQEDCHKFEASSGYVEFKASLTLSQKQTQKMEDKNTGFQTHFPGGGERASSETGTCVGLSCGFIAPSRSWGR